MIAGKEEIARYFESLLNKHGDDFLSLDWKSKESQLVRFAALIDIIFHGPKNSSISLLDVGCGIGHLYEFLKDTDLIHSLNIRYEGIDISSGMIDFARKKFKDVKFAVVDILNDGFDGKFDYVMCSGAFNIRMAPLEAHKGSVRRMLKKMFDISDHGAAVNFLSPPRGHEGEASSDDKYVYFSEEEVLSWVKDTCDRFILRRDYHPGDFTVYMLK